MLFYFIANKLWAWTHKWQHWIDWPNRKDKSHKRCLFQSGNQAKRTSWPGELTHGRHVLPLQIAMVLTWSHSLPSIRQGPCLSLHSIFLQTFALPWNISASLCFASWRQFGRTSHLRLDALLVARRHRCRCNLWESPFHRFVSWQGNVRRWLAVTPDFVLQLLRQGLSAWSLDEEISC